MIAEKKFYGTILGNSLIDHNNYPPGIIDFLNDEKKILISIIKKYSILVEVGCMHGRYLKDTFLIGKEYIGIDIIPEYINEAKKKSESLKDFNPILFCENIENLEKIIQKIKSKSIDLNECLFFFPFNSFGNIRNNILVLNKLVIHNIDYLISTYKITKEATDLRKKYYENCSFKNLRYICKDESIRFISDDGLDSIAFDEQWFKLQNRGRSLFISDIAEHGQAFYGI